jgi:hypothetical protein
MPFITSFKAFVSDVLLYGVKRSGWRLVAEEEI